MKKVMVILNPTAGSEKAGKYKDKIKAKFEEYFDFVDIRETQKEGDATDFAGEASENGYEAIVAAGGDGTINEVIAGMAEREYRPKLCIIPLGTGNMLARVVGLPLDVDDAIECIDFEKTRAVDIGKANDRYFGYVFSIGSVSEAVHNVGIEEKTKFGAFAYAINTFRGMVNDRLFHVRVESENNVFNGMAGHVLILLTDCFGDIRILEDNEEAGKANVFIIKEANISSKLSIVSDLIKGNVENNDNVEFFKAAEIRVSSDEEEVESDIDGDKGDNLPVDIKVLKRHIEVYC